MDIGQKFFNLMVDMKLNVGREVVAVIVVAIAPLISKAAPLTTLQNSPLSVPAASISSLGATNLAGTNFMLSALATDSAQGGHGLLMKSPQWNRRYNGGGNTDNSAYGLVVRKDGSVVVTGTSSTFNTSDFATICYASDGSPVWTNRYDSPAHGHESARFIAANDSGDVWVAGSSTRDATNTTADVVTIRYASNGVPVWTNRYSSFETNSAGATGLVVDNLGNSYMEQWSGYYPPGGILGTPIESSIIKYDGAGNTVWVKHFLQGVVNSGQALHDAGPMALDATGNLFVLGETGHERVFSGTSLVKYSAAGTELWTNDFSSKTLSNFRDLHVDANQNIVLTGETNDNAYVVMKCASDGTMLWTNAISGPPYNGGNVPQTALDAAGDVFLIGGRPGSEVGFYRAVKFSPGGVPLWTNANIFLGTNDMIYACGADAAGNLYIVGETDSPTEVGEYDYLTLKCSSESGQIIWTNRLSGPGLRQDIPFAMTVDPSGNVYVTGQSPGGNRNDFWTIKYSDSAFYSPPKDFTGLDTLFYTLTDNFGHSATGSVDVAVNPGSFRFGNSSTVGFSVQLQLDGFPGTNWVVLEASTNFSDWQPILTNAPSNGTVQFLDSAAANGIQRFYRAFQTQ